MEPSSPSSRFWGRGLRRDSRPARPEHAPQTRRLEALAGGDPALIALPGHGPPVGRQVRRPGVRRRELRARGPPAPAGRRPLRQRSHGRAAAGQRRNRRPAPQRAAPRAGRRHASPRDPSARTSPAAGSPPRPARVPCSRRAARGRVEGEADRLPSRFGKTARAPVISAVPESSTSVDLAAALGCIAQDEAAPLRRLSNYRNQFAHDLDRSLTESDGRDLKNALGLKSARTSKAAPRAERRRGNPGRNDLRRSQGRMSRSS